MGVIMYNKHPTTTKLSIVRWWMMVPEIPYTSPKSDTVYPDTIHSESVTAHPEILFNPSTIYSRV